MNSTSKRLLAAAATAAALATSSVVLATPAQAHDPQNCVHANWRDGSWFMDYIGHFNSGSNHYNVYDHYLDGVFQHTQVLLCG